MNDELILLKCGEISLKGLNRRRFESILLSNLRHRLRRVGSFSCQILQSTVTVSCLEQDPPEALLLGAPSLMDRPMTSACACSALSRRARARLSQGAAPHL